MAEADAEIVFKARIDAEEFNKDIEILKKQLQEKKNQIDNLKKAYSDLSSGKTKSQEQLRLEEKLNKLIEKRKDIEDKILSSGKKDKGSSLVNQLKDVNRVIPKVQNALDKIKIKPASAQSVRDLARELDLARRESIKLGNAIQQRTGLITAAQIKQKKEAEKLYNEDIKREKKKNDKIEVNAKKAADAKDIAWLRSETKLAAIEAKRDQFNKSQALKDEKFAFEKEKEKTRIAEREKKERYRIAEKEARQYEKQQKELQRAAEKSVREQQRLAEKLTKEEQREQRERAKAAEREARERAKSAEKASKEQARAAIAADKLAKQRSEAFKKSFAGAFKGLISPITSVIGKVSEFGKRILRLGNYVLVFSLIRAGFRQLQDYLIGSLKTNDIFVKSLNNIKSNLMVAFYPIYQYILPAVNALMQALVKASAYFAQFMSMLTGKSIQESQAGAKALYMQTQAVNDSSQANKNNTSAIHEERAAFDKLGKSIKNSKKELASFDKLNVLNQEKIKTPKVKTPKSDGFIFSPTTAFDSTYDKMTTIFDKISKKIEPLKSKFKDLGITIKETFGKFAKNAVNDFYEEFAKPFGNWTVNKGLPEFVRITKNMLKSIDWDKLNNALKDFWKVLEPFAEHVGEGLLWFYEHVVAKFATWTLNTALPVTLKALGEALKWIDENVGADNVAIGILAALATYKVASTAWEAITFVQKMTKALEGMTTAEIILKAFQGPAGWVALAAGVGIAAALGVKAYRDSQDKIEQIRKEKINELLKDEGKTYDDLENMSDEERSEFIKNWTKKYEVAHKLSEKERALIFEGVDKRRLVYQAERKSKKEVLDQMLKDTGKTYDEFKNMREKDKIELISSWAETQADNNGLIGEEREKFIKSQKKALRSEINISKSFKETLQDKANDIGNWFTDQYNVFCNWASETYDKFITSLGKIKNASINRIRTDTNWLIDRINDGLNWLIRKLNWCIDQLNKIHVDIPEWVPGIGGRRYGVDINRIPEGSWNIPKFAQGAVLKGGNPILAYLNDQPRGQVNIETPLDTMIQAFKTALNSNEASYNNNITIQANGDLNSIISLLDFKIKQNNQRVGTNYVTGDVWI